MLCKHQKDKQNRALNVSGIINKDIGRIVECNGMMTFSTLTTCKESIRRQIEVSIMNKNSIGKWMRKRNVKRKERQQTRNMNGKNLFQLHTRIDL
jgi:hypothetical protein